MMADAKTPRWYWEDFPVGHQLQFGAMAVTREAIIAFATQFDPQPFHLDEEVAKTSLLGGLCASGWHTASMAMRMMCDAYLLDAASMGSPGLEQLRWLAPVFPGDVLHVRYEVLAARPMTSRPQVGLVNGRWTVLNQREQVVMTMEGWGMFARREAASASASAST
jgi:acyl dehydratase